VGLCWRQTPIFAVFGLRHLLLSPFGSSLRKLNTGATTNLPLPNGIKIVSVFQRLHGEIGCTISDVQKCDEQTDRLRFWPPRQWVKSTRRRVKSEPHQSWHDDRGPRAHSCTSRTFPGATHSFAARGCSTFGGNPTPSI